MEPRNPVSSSTSEQISSRAPKNSATLLSNQNKVTPLITTLNQMYSVKLDRNNGLLWLSMVLPIIKGIKLNGIIFGTKQCPEMFIHEGDEEGLNSAFEDWTTIDQLLLGWLYNAMTVEVASQIIGRRIS